MTSIAPQTQPTAVEREARLRRPRRPAGLSGAAAQLSGPLVRVFLSRPTVGPPAALRLRVEREQRGIFAAGTSSTDTRVRAVDYATGRRLAEVDVPMSLTLWNLGRHDAEGEAVLSLPPSIAASRRIYLKAVDRDGIELGRTGGFSIADLARAGSGSALVDDDRTALERLGDDADGAANTGTTLAIAGAAGAVALLLLLRAR